MLEEVEGGQVYPYNKSRPGYQKLDQSHSGYSLNVLNLEGDSLGSSFNSRFSRHSYDHQGVQTMREMTNKVRQINCFLNLLKFYLQNIQADLDMTRTVLDESASSGDLSLPSNLGQVSSRQCCALLNDPFLSV